MKNLQAGFISPWQNILLPGYPNNSNFKCPKLDHILTRLINFMKPHSNFIVGETQLDNHIIEQ